MKWELNALLYKALCESLSLQGKRLSKSYFTAVLHALRLVYRDGMSAREACGLAAVCHHSDLTGEHFDRKGLLDEIKHPMQIVKKIGRGT